jgi:hypothetical protein
MKTLSPAIAALAFFAAANISQAIAQGPKPSGDNTWLGISHRSDPGPSSAVTMPHYEYQYGYDRHSHWRGQWVLVR